MKPFVCGKPRKCSWCLNYSRVGDRAWFNDWTRETICDRCNARSDYVRQLNIPRTVGGNELGGKDRPFSMGSD